MQTSTLTNQLILRIINELHQELPMEFLQETRYYNEELNQISPLESVNLLDIIYQSYNAYGILNQVIFLNTDDNHISIFDIENDDLYMENKTHPENAPLYLGDLTLPDNQYDNLHLYLIID